MSSGGLKNKFGKKKKGNEEMGLQITSMADIFMILLVFLLKSFSTGASAISPNSEMTLPEARSETAMKDTLKLEISKNLISVDDKSVIQLINYNFPAIEISANASSSKLLGVLLEQRKHIPVPNMDSNMLILADEGTPYSTLKTVLASAAGAGFVDLQMVIMEKE